ncbi:MAG: hypothetical protein A3G24_13525 [Betaproteobacteria bacterium RIFCSPLOWO2_12_FULL_62_13]|nr:MAG: hypothetical protein A3G24_13525 [Betaproteobacteria bacterium RIFCSPLOWO2_12_FULL_62_13]
MKRRSDPGETERLLLPVMPDGRIYELIKLPDDMTSLVWQLPDSGRKRTLPYAVESTILNLAELRCLA